MGPKYGVRHLLIRLCPSVVAAGTGGRSSTRSPDIGESGLRPAISPLVAADLLESAGPEFGTPTESS